MRRALDRKFIALLCILAVPLLTSCGRSPASKDPAADIQLAWSAFSRDDFAQASDLFQAVADAAAPANPLHDQAIFGLANTSAFRRPDPDLPTAENLFRQLIEHHPGDNLGAWSALAIARMYHVRPVGDPIDLPRVAALYQFVIDHFPNTPAAEEAFIYDQTISATSTDPTVARASLALLIHFLEAHPKSPYRSAAWQLIANAQHVLLQPDEELAAQIRALQTREQDPQNPTLDSAQAYWIIATTAEFDAGNLPIARQYYNLFIQQAPTDQKVFTARQALARLGTAQTQWTSAAEMAAPALPSH